MKIFKWSWSFLTQSAVIVTFLVSGLCCFLIIIIPLFFTSLESKDIFSFSGSIIGGGLTFIGVWLTLNHETTLKTKELQPFLTINDDNSPLIYFKKHYTKTFTLKNIGNYSANDICLHYYAKESEYTNRKFNIEEQSTKNIKIIFNQDSISLEILFNTSNNDFRKDEMDIFECICELKYIGFNDDKHTIKYKIQLYLSKGKVIHSCSPSIYLIEYN